MNIECFYELSQFIAKNVLAGCTHLACYGTGYQVCHL